MPDTISVNDIASILGLKMRLDEQEQLKQDQAVRFAGAREYDALLSEGVPHEEALRRTAHRMFYNDPGAMTGALRLAPTKEPEQPVLMNVGGTAIRVDPSGKVETLFTPPKDETERIMQTERGPAIIRGGKLIYPEIEGTPADAGKPTQTVSERLSLMREKRELRKELENLTPGTPEYQDNLRSVGEIDRLLGVQPVSREPAAEPEKPESPPFWRNNPLFFLGQNLGRKLPAIFQRPPAAGATNAPPVPTTASPVPNRGTAVPTNAPPVASRQVGTTVRTPKGTFRWNGSRWLPL